jgi:hypothetical protein
MPAVLCLLICNNLLTTKEYIFDFYHIIKHNKQNIVYKYVQVKVKYNGLAVSVDNHRWLWTIYQSFW